MTLIHTCSSGTLTCDSPFGWAQTFPFDFKTTFAILTRDLPGTFHIDIKIAGDTRVSPAMKILGNGIEFSCLQGPEPRVVGTGNLVISPELQRLGIGRNFIRNRLDFHFGSGRFDELYTQAGLDNGGFTWAKFGLLPVDLSASDCTLQEEVRFRLRAIDPLLHDNERDYVSSIPHFLMAPKSVWHLADANFDVGQRLRSCPPNLRKQIENAFASTYQFGEPAVKKIFERAQAGKIVTLGEYSLTGTCWEGYFDRYNNEQMQRIANYTGGFQHIKLG